MKDRSSENSSESTSRSHTPGGISFNGSVTFNAPMFDIRKLPILGYPLLDGRQSAPV